MVCWSQEWTGESSVSHSSAPSSLRVSNRSIGMYDLRFLPSASSTTRARPYLELEGHVNSFTVDVGLSSWQDSFVAVGGSTSSSTTSFIADLSIITAGQDSKVRIWSLRTGSLLSPPSFLLSPPTPAPALPSFSPWPAEPIPTPSPLARTFSSPVKALQFADRGLGEVPKGRRELEREGWRRGGGPVLWVGDGGGLECFEVP